MKKYSKSTLYQLSKKELIDYINMLYHNLEVITEAYTNATNFYCKEVEHFIKSLNGEGNKYE